jgi:hypothetical protein
MERQKHVMLQIQQIVQTLVTESRMIVKMENFGVRDFINIVMEMG